MQIFCYLSKRYPLLLKALYLRLTVAVTLAIVLSAVPNYALPDFNRTALITATDISEIKTEVLKIDYPVLSISKEKLDLEQIKNFAAEYQRIQRIIELVLKDVSEEQKRRWQLLLIGTVAVESNFLDRYSGKSPNGNGPYQIIGNTVYGIIHSYITYPIEGSSRVGERRELMTLFEEATNGRVTWDRLVKMDRSQLIELCVRDYDFSALVSLLIYKEAFTRHGIRTVPPDAEGLGKLWKQYYNTPQGIGTIERFTERFHALYKSNT